MNKLCMLLTLCLWCAISYAGQTDYQVKGRLVDAESGAVIDFADVFCSEPAKPSRLSRLFPISTEYLVLQTYQTGVIS